MMRGVTTALGARVIPLRPSKDAYYLDIANAGIADIVTEPR